jgi:hypothetical protein
MRRLRRVSAFDVFLCLVEGLAARSSVALGVRGLGGSESVAQLL